MTDFKGRINSSGASGQQAPGSNPNPLGDASALKKAYDTFIQNFALAIPSVVLFVAEVIVTVLFMILVAAALGISYPMASFYELYGVFAAGILSMIVRAVSALIYGILTGIFVSATLVEANAALSSNSYSFGAAMGEVKKKLNQILTFSLVLGVADLIWAFTGMFAWFLDAITNMVFIVSFAFVLAGESGTLTNVIQRSASSLLAWLGKDPISILSLFVAAIFLGFPIVEFAAMPMAALIVMIFYGGEKQAQSTASTTTTT